MRSFARLFVLAICCVSDSAHAADYVWSARPGSGRAQVTAKLAQGEARAFRMPAWAPGDYELFHYGRAIESIEFRKEGRVVPSRQGNDPNLWELPEGADEARYTVGPSEGNFSVNLRVAADHAFVSGPGVFGWFAGDQLKRQTLRVEFPLLGAKVFTTLKAVNSEPSPRVFEAPDYDELIDAPFVVGAQVRSADFVVRGKTLSVVAFNQAADADLAGFVKVGRAAAEVCHDLFGELPFTRYLFFCDFGGEGGGLEHLNSARLGLWRGARGDVAAGFVFHEFFHLYNVKRIRERPLGPFDYTQPAKVKTLWWLEGVTDYYASVLQVRSGLQPRVQFVSEMSQGIRRFARDPSRLRASAEESSLRVWEARGSSGFGGVNYYEKGRLVGLCLDLAIRGKSGGRASLDDVIRDLYQECKGGKPGYDEPRIRELCVKHGGPELARIYDLCARQPAELPVAEVARAAGLRWNGQVFAVDPNATAGAKAAGERWPMPIRLPTPFELFLAAQ